MPSSDDGASTGQGQCPAAVDYDAAGQRLANDGESQGQVPTGEEENWRIHGSMSEGESEAGTDNQSECSYTPSAAACVTRVYECADDPEQIILRIACLWSKKSKEALGGRDTLKERRCKLVR